MKDDRQEEIHQLIESCRKFGLLPHEVQKAMDEMYAVIERIPDLDYVLNVDSTWKDRKQKIKYLRDAIKDLLPYLSDINEARNYASMNDGTCTGWHSASIRARSTLSQVECEQCFDEFGSYSCIRPVHKNNS